MKEQSPSASDVHRAQVVLIGLVEVSDVYSPSCTPGNGVAIVAPLSVTPCPIRSPPTFTVITDVVDVGAGTAAAAGAAATTNEPAVTTNARSAAPHARADRRRPLVAVDETLSLDISSPCSLCA